MRIRIEITDRPTVPTIQIIYQTQYFRLGQVDGVLSCYHTLTCITRKLSKNQAIS